MEASEAAGITGIEKGTFDFMGADMIFNFVEKPNLIIVDERCPSH